MPLVEKLRDLFRSDAEHYVYKRIPSAGDGRPAKPLRAGQDYFRLTLCEMYLGTDRRWFTTYYPAVHSLVRLQHGSKTVELPHIAGPLDLKGVSSENLANVIQLNHRMTGLLPFNGGELELNAGMLAIKGDDALPRLIGVLSQFGGMLQIPQLSTALAVAGPLAKGIQSLFVGDDDSLVLGLHQSFTASEADAADAPVPGHFAAFLATEKDLAGLTLSVEENRLRVSRDGGPPQGLTGVPYMLFRLDRQSERDDWEGLTDLLEPFEKATEALLVDRSPERAEGLVRTGLALVLSSPDLTWNDRLQVAKRLKQRHDKAKQLGDGAAPADLTSALELAQRAAPPRRVSELDLELASQELIG